jgi:CheY-like chemotaxis protein
MEQPKMEETLAYVISCFNCGNSFDALDTVWCGCLTSDRTVVCPTCNQCFCKASHSYKDDVWSHAPQLLWDQKVEFESEGISSSYPDPKDVERPLVLVVDDEPIIQKIAVRAIESLGYCAILAHDGMEGLALAKKYRPDLVLSDMLMPKMDGQQMFRFLKADPDTAKTKVVLMTSLYTKSKHRAEAFRHIQPDGYLSKPLSFPDLWAVLKKHLS